ncbi:phage tail assembly chaperone [Pseudomonas fuscovaginae UPB0736]|uniref:phage tail assembly chaperone n=1 Tax=Pseudomonas asplenii TaxID=53407 RepID=UPI0002880FA3|nr:phage tail assembly chaperone [Pseudomonas fuscovaginae]UUQ66354.1 phage tail assembly chaperone [Pseudomonas fuscovaginae UPB0736]
MKKYARITNGKVDNIYETVNDITEEFPAGGLWVLVSEGTWVDYGANAVNNGGVWSFSGMPLQDGAEVYKQRYISNTYFMLERTALQFKSDLGIATAAEEAELIAQKQYILALRDVNKQPGFPLTVNWPVAP